MLVGGKYRLDRLIGRGGMGSVWSCRHATLGAPFAVKFLRPDLASDDMARTRFEREAKAAAALRTRHTVRVHDHGCDGEHAFIVMELLEGEDLRSRLRRLGRLGLDETRDVIVQIAKGLQHAHEARIVHRDLKPANIFFARDDGGETVKILDFGIAKTMGAPAEGAAATQTGAILGSPHYMSPEQIRGHWSQVDHRTDLWALAVIAFRALTGQLPFMGDVVGDVMVKVCIDPIPVPSSIAPGLPRELDRFFERALAREREQRFRSGYELAVAFCRAIGGAPPDPDPRASQPSFSDSADSWELRRATSGPEQTDSITAITRSMDQSAVPTERVAAIVDDEAPTLSASEGTLTEAGSLQLEPRPEPASNSRLWAFGVAAVLAAASLTTVGLMVGGRGEQPARLAPALATNLPGSTAPVGTTTLSASEPVPEPASAASVASAKPAASASAGKPAARRPRAPRKPKSGFGERFGYE